MRRRPSDPPAIDPADLERLLTATHSDPFAVLGMHVRPGSPQVVVRCIRPGARTVEVIERDTGKSRGALRRVRDDVFAGALAAPEGRFPYRLRVDDGEVIRDLEDAYAFAPLLGELDCYLLAEGRHWHAASRLGAHPGRLDRVDGVSFVVWAPNAQRVSVVGTFNAWDGHVHPMRLRPECGMWELFIPDVALGALYKYELRTADGQVILKSDPWAFACELPPATASRVWADLAEEWHDADWMRSRQQRQSTQAPLAIYEVHVGSWRRHPDGHQYQFDELADALIPYVLEMGFTHIELLPVNEHPFTGSWGYQPTGLLAPSARWGAPDAFRRFVDRCHVAGIGVLLDWVPAHFPADEHGLARFDGTCLYEHADPRMGYHQGWGTLVYNFGRHEVANFLIAGALHWLRHYHLDGLRVDAVASMLYLDYDRAQGEWISNRHGGRENLDAVDFLRRFNDVLREQAPDGVITIAEESTAWPGVTRPTHLGGLGFDYKWNMGWMNDTLGYMRHDPVHRRFHHDQLTFGLLYAYSEQFILPVSHDEVVHGKGSLQGRMPGDMWQRMANVRLYLAFQYTQPGRKLLFMGSEFAQDGEWNHDAELDWACLQWADHAGVQQLVRDLNRLYRERPALYLHDGDGRGFAWIDCSDHEQSVLAYRRLDDQSCKSLVVVCNFTPVPRTDYRIGAVSCGRYREILNTDASDYGGSGMGNLGGVDAQPQPAHGLPCSLVLTLPPLACVVFEAPAEST
ncbi:1,4-alpha-glucan branching protein GlgB [Oleiagrimonas sp. C23AA]|uniref:1,4-alpha-glucan branching protein GlgB n=1 Tax=Oleiagrimonas sp. C23AA TaxID=2719047 RepID=UPI00141D880A|nr:1,4-alpha-glucan branching protein GlgB [Oleiagrimonas sp. C23AA]NII11093.1 1,4-alpha-glucan branching protein GlgB [Oleiagrimonas sp. C23AA]